MSGGRVATDRVGLPARWAAGAATATATSLALASRLVSDRGPNAGWAMLGGFLAGLLGVLALQSVSIRGTCRWLSLVSTLLVVRYGAASIEETSGAATVLAWLAATVTTLVVASALRRFALVAAADTTSAAGAGPFAAPRSGVMIARVAVGVVCLAAAAGLGFGPVAAERFATGPTAGERPSLSTDASGSPLLATGRVDMTNRPNLTDAVVLHVRGDESGFLRTQVFDQWDRSSWTRTDESVVRVADDGTVEHPATDLVGSRNEVVRQEIEVVAGFASALPLAPDAVRVTASVQLGQWADGTVGAIRPLGAGGRYLVESRRVRGLTAGTLRASADGDRPDDLMERFAAEPGVTARVRRLAEELFAGTTNDYDKVRSVEAWLGRNTRYSLDAPLAPAGSDVVDDFLFESREGWCEQIASSLTVLLRQGGVPARLAVGFVVDERDAVSGRMVVRANDAHAWTEVWFPDVGWVPFDPTASVPLSGRAPSTVSTVSTGAVLRVLTWVLPVVGATATVGPWLVDAWRRRRSGRGRLGGRRRNSGAPTTWTGDADVRLARVGSRLGRPRSDAETSAAYAGELARLGRDPRWAGVGEVIDRARFAAEPPSLDERAAVDALLDEMDAAVPASPAGVEPADPVSRTPRR